MRTTMKTMSASMFVGSDMTLWWQYVLSSFGHCQAPVCFVWSRPPSTTHKHRDETLPFYITKTNKYKSNTNPQHSSHHPQRHNPSVFAKTGPALICLWWSFRQTSQHFTTTIRISFRCKEKFPVLYLPSLHIHPGIIATPQTRKLLKPPG